jgi:tyrosine-protein kinase Etk/Wzc
LITAALPNEGKSWVAASLAVSLAADGYSVALVDCDVNRPTVHRMFNGPRGPGLTDYLAERVGFDEVAHSDPTSGLSYIPIGSAMARDTWRKTFSFIPPLIDRLREKYAFVILDSPPVLAVSDTILLSQIAQKTILVVKWASTPPAVARRAAVQLLESAGADVAALLSMVNTKRAAKNGDPIASVYKQLGGYYQR